MRILGIETSCDETGVALYDGAEGLMAHALYSQIELHAQYGGVVPELASRDHIRKTLPLIQEVLDKAHTDPKEITGIAYTAGPGLIGALLVGGSIAKGLAYAWGVPCVGVHHLESHFLAALLEKPAPQFPFLALLVSGGHTLLAKISALGEYEILGESVDDAAGEAFDKTAKLLGLGYPGGPQLAALAQLGKPTGLQFPRPMTQQKSLNFSFSGLKTSVLQRVQHNSEFSKADIAYAFQAAAIDTLLIKCRWAIEKTGLKQLVVAGGVGANIALRSALGEWIATIGGQVFYPNPAFCTDNGAMVAFAGYCHFANGTTCDSREINVKARWPLSDCAPM